MLIVEEKVDRKTAQSVLRQKPLRNLVVGPKRKPAFLAAASASSPVHSRMRLHELFRSIAFVARMVVQDIWQAIWKVSRRSDEIESQMKRKFKVFLAKVGFGFGMWFPKQTPTILSNCNHYSTSVSGACAGPLYPFPRETSNSRLLVSG